MMRLLLDREIMMDADKHRAWMLALTHLFDDAVEALPLITPEQFAEAYPLSEREAFRQRRRAT